MYRIAVLEDTPGEAEVIESALRRYAEERGRPVSLKLYTSGERFLEEYEPGLDLVLMDIEMPGISGMETAEQLRKRDEDVPLIFVTKMANYAVQGYSVRAMDFVVKPVVYENLAIKLDRALRAVDRRRNCRVVIQNGELTRWLNTEEILYVEVMNHTLFYHTAEEKISAYGTIKDCEQKLAPRGFARCSNSFLVNLNHVRQVRGSDVLVGEQWLPIGRTKRREFMQRLAEFAGDMAI